jgi:hypothetical protein
MTRLAESKLRIAPAGIASADTFDMAPQTGIFSHKANKEAITATPNKAGDRRNIEIVVTNKPAKKLQNSNGSSALHAPTKVAGVPTSLDARMEWETSCSEIDCPLPKNHRECGFKEDAEHSPVRGKGKAIITSMRSASHLPADNTVIQIVSASLWP